MVGGFKNDLFLERIEIIFSYKFSKVNILRKRRSRTWCQEEVCLKCSQGEGNVLVKGMIYGVIPMEQEEEQSLPLWTWEVKRACDHKGVLPRSWMRYPAPLGLSQTDRKWRTDKRSGYTFWCFAFLLHAGGIGGVERQGQRNGSFEPRAGEPAFLYALVGK